MDVSSTELPGVRLLEPDVYEDKRGSFMEVWNARDYGHRGIEVSFVQDNLSRSRRGILRGLHMQVRHVQGKLVRVVRGEAYDVAVDARAGSPHFGRFAGVVLSAERMNQLYVPPGFAHGFCVVTDEAEIEYKCTDVYDPSSEVTIAWNDPEIGIPWPCEAPLLSEKDLRGRPLAELVDRLPRYEGP